MKHWHRLLIIALVVGALALALLAPGKQGSLAVNGTIHYVDADATTGANNGTSWVDAFTELQAALAEASSGDEIWVAEGIYTPAAEHGGIGDRYKSFQLMNSVALYGGFDPTVGDVAFEDRDWEGNPTILSGDLDGDDGPDFANNDENSYHVFYHPSGTGLDSTAILDGFTVSGGNANGDYYNGSGGGMANYGSSPALTNCTFSGNSAAHYGGGMYNEGSSPALTNCTFSGNSADSGGGGMFNEKSSPALTNCTFSGNSAGSGGGMYNQRSSPTLINCTFSGNSADSGGGMNNGYSSSPALINCTFSGNSAGTRGGGMNNWSSSSPALTNCTFSGNSADSGGGMYNDDSSPTLTNCTFSGNSATGGGGMRNTYSSPALTNCILWGDIPDEISSDSSSSPIVTYGDIQGGYSGEGNIDADPLFVDPSSGDFHLGAGSPCIDAGYNAAPDLPPYDFEGDARILDGDGNVTAIVDMGVDEVAVDWPYFHVYLPVVLRGY